MTFEEWWDSTGTNATPNTYKGWEESCRQAWAMGANVEREACANVCEEEICSCCWTQDAQAGAEHLAEQIRKRSNI